MGFNWGGKKWRPANVPKGQPKINQSIEELLKPLSEKKWKGNVWGSQIMNVEKETTPDVSPSPTPSVTPTPSGPIPSVTPTPSLTPTPTPSTTPPATPQIEYITTVSSNSNTTTYSFSNIAIGGPGLIIGVIGTAGNTGSATVINSVTYNGNAMTTSGTTLDTTNGGTPSNGIAFRQYVETTSNNADITVTYANAMRGCAVALYRITNVTSYQYEQAQNPAASNTTSQTVTFTDATQPSVGFVAAIKRNETQTISFSNATKNVQIDFTGSADRPQFAVGLFTINSSSYSITASTSSSYLQKTLAVNYK